MILLEMLIHRQSVPTISHLLKILTDMLFGCVNPKQAQLNIQFFIKLSGCINKKYHM
jgi:hypothetical protein